MKSNKVSKVKKNKFKRKSKNNDNKKRQKIYTYNIRTAIVNYVTPDYTEKNLKFPIYDMLRDTQVFKVLEKQYLQYKLDKVTFAATPRQVNGTDPAPVWIYLDTNGINQIQYAALQELQGSRPLPVKHFSLTSFSSSGRQNDFHYWYDVQIEGSDVAIRLHSEAIPNTTKFWQFQIGFKVKFRGFAVTQEQNRNLKVQEVKIKSESSREEKQGLIQENENSDEDWNQVDSEMEENVD
jgi:hypothetical protein